MLWARAINTFSPTLMMFSSYHWSSLVRSLHSTNWWWFRSEPHIYLSKLKVNLNVISACHHPPSLLLPPSLSSSKWWFVGRCISLLIMWMHWFSFCQQMPNDLLALAFRFQIERKTNLFTSIIPLSSVSVKWIQRLVGPEEASRTPP